VSDRHVAPVVALPDGAYQQRATAKRIMIEAWVWVWRSTAPTKKRQAAPRNATN